LIVFDPSTKLHTSGLAAFARRAQRLAKVPGQVEILITGNRRIRELNRRFGKRDKPTDVLSFPRSDGGDIAISADMAAANAARFGHAARDELRILILHGMLHLAGYDHERDNGEMAAKETALRQRLGLPGSLIARAQRRRRLE
jgi:probable rRNA maturation factor